MTLIKYNNGGRITIDSLRIDIPLYDIEILDPVLSDGWIYNLVNEETGENIELDEEEYNKKATRVIQNGVVTKYAVVSNIDRSDGLMRHHKFVRIGFNAKLLYDKYFLGIDRDNLFYIYSSIMAQGKVKFSFETFLYSKYADVDFKRDFHMPLEEYKEFIKLEHDNYWARSQRRKKNVGAWHFKDSKKDKSENFGLEFNERGGNNHINHPYLKYYNKESELKADKNREFTTFIWSDHWENQHCDYMKDLRRLEITLKNIKHVESILKQDCGTLEELTGLSQKMRKVLLYNHRVKNFANENVEYNKKEIVYSELKPDQMLSAILIEFILSKGIDATLLDTSIYSMIEKNFDFSLLDDRKERNNMRQKQYQMRKKYEKLRENEVTIKHAGNSKAIELLNSFMNDGVEEYWHNLHDKKDEKTFRNEKEEIEKSMLLEEINEI